MVTDPLYDPITADQFLDMDFGSDRKFELVDGVIHMMTGGSDRHAHVAGNLYVALRTALRGSKCRPFNSDMGVRVSDHCVRYPDVSIVCRDDWLIAPEVLAFEDPMVIFEVLSPSIATFDQGTKLAEYRQLPSLQAIVFVDPINRLTRVYRRMGPATWHDTSFARPHDVELPELGVVLSEAEIFARD